jgi:hypothetical protein
MHTDSRNFRAIILILGLIFQTVAHAGSQKQTQLDQACEAAREQKLAPMRQEYIEECVAKKQRPDRESCERFYADFGAQSGSRAPLFYDLPECVEAFEHKRNPK